MESNKQERYDLLHDNPVAKDASGGREGSWMSKHSQSHIGSPLHRKGTAKDHGMLADNPKWLEHSKMAGHHMPDKK